MKRAIDKTLKTISILFLLQLFIRPDTFCQLNKHIPSKWLIALQAEGDFNKDGLKDYFVMIDSTEVHNTWVIEKRVLLIFHGSAKGLYLADKNEQLFLERSRIVDADVMEITVKENVIKLGAGDINFRGGCNGGLGYTFRFQNANWYAIGCNWSCSNPAVDDNNKQILKKAKASVITLLPEILNI